jgi:hypothetical protein
MWKRNRNGNFLLSSVSCSFGDRSAEGEMQFLAIALLAFVASCTSLEAGQPTCQGVIDARYPRQYVAYKSTTPPVLDGNLDEPFWLEVPFTENYVDISTAVVPKYITRAKVRWDEEWLYVGGYIQENELWANITHTCHCYDPTENQVIFTDNDFEVFVDADGSCWYYKEYEMNAANANWDLCLNKPYEDGGYENSTRVFGDKGFDMVPPLRSAVFSNGELNDPSKPASFWSVEIAFPLSKLAYNTTASVPPKKKDMWRINFSRVEWTVKIVNGSYQKYPSCQSCPEPGSSNCDNWVWSPMYAVDMHHPELWGFLEFSDDAVNSTQPQRSVEWPQRFAAHELYYAQHAYASSHGNVFTSDVAALAQFATFPQVLLENCTVAPSIVLGAGGTTFVATIGSIEIPGMNVTVTNDRHILAHYPSQQ